MLLRYLQYIGGRWRRICLAVLLNKNKAGCGDVSRDVAQRGKLHHGTGTITVCVVEQVARADIVLDE